MPIKTEEQYQWVLRRIDELMRMLDTPPQEAYGLELELLTEMADEYEKETMPEFRPCSSEEEQRICDPQVGGSNPSQGHQPITAFLEAEHDRPNVPAKARTVRPRRRDE